MASADAPPADEPRPHPSRASPKPPHGPCRRPGPTAAPHTQSRARSAGGAPLPVERHAPLARCAALYKASTPEAPRAFWRIWWASRHGSGTAWTARPRPWLLLRLLLRSRPCAAAAASASGTCWVESRCCRPRACPWVYAEALAGWVWSRGRSERSWGGVRWLLTVGSGSVGSPNAAGR